MGKWRWLPILVLALGAAAVWPLRGQLTAAGIAALSPRQGCLAAVFLWGLYALKGFSVAFPLAALEAAGGLLFPLPAAVAVNWAGVLAAQAGPYLLGRRRPADLASLTARWPRLAVLPPGPPGRTVFLLRLAGAAPGDLVSYLLGAAGMPRRAYFFGGALGSLPRVVSATVLGAALWEFGSPRFLLSLLPGAGLTALSLVLWRRWRRAGAAP